MAEGGLYEIWKLERAAWTLGPGAISHVGDDALVMPPDPMPVQVFADLRDASTRAEPFTDVELEDRHFVQRGDTVVIAYTASARHKRFRRRYRARCMSTYVREAGEWRCVGHSHARV